MLQQTVASQISRENLGCPVVYGNMQVIKDGGYEQEQVSQPISARQLDCSGGNGARAGVARCAKTLQSCFTHLYFPHDYLHVATCKVTNPNDYSTAKPIVELYPIYFYVAWGSLTHADPTQKFLLYVHQHIDLHSHALKWCHIR